MSQSPSHASAGDGSLVHAFGFDGRGRGVPIDWKAIASGLEPDNHAFVWTHFDRGGSQTHDWLRERAGLDPLVIDALMAEETRPRVSRHGAGVILILRGVNLHPGADPEDMVSIRMWVEPRRIISVRIRRLNAVASLVDEIGQGHAPSSTGGLVTRLAMKLTQLMDPVVQEIDEDLDDLEERSLTDDISDLRRDLGELRVRAITLRRYLAPQRDAYFSLGLEPLSWIDENRRARLREA